MPRKLLVGGVQRNGTLKGITIKKVLPPTVPDLPCKLSIHSSTYIPNGDDVTEGFDDPCLGIESEEVYALPPPRSPCSDQNLISPCAYSSLYPPMKKMAPGDGPNGQIHVAHVIVHSQPDSLPSTPVEVSHSPYLTKGRFMSGTQGSLEDQGIDVSPGRHSPGGSSGGSSISRHSLSSIDSGRASAPGNDTKVVNRRLSVQSYESGGGSPQRRSYHSSSSSIASGEDLGQGPNVAEMVLHGLPDVEVLSSWLSSLHFEEYIPLFLQAGYDMPTITRMTPEDLTAVGVTKPNHRRKLKAEIAKLNISDGIPEYKPNTLLEWLQLLRLEEYYGTLCQQGYDTVDKVTELTWEDLEDIGIQKLGHQKKILLAIKRVEDINQGRRPNLVPEPPAHMQMMHATLLQDASSTLPRPSTLGTIQPYHYPCQEIAIATHRPKNSPSTDSIPEMKTFQQSPIKEDHFLHSSTQSVTTASQQQNGNISQVLSPCRGRSLESLNAEDGAMMTSQMPPVSYNPSYQPAAEPPKPQSRDWRVTDLDTDYGFDCDGTATLNRPKGLVKFRPVAKISAKTREEIAEAILDIPDKDFKLLLNQSRTLDGWSSLDGSPRHGPATVPRASTLKRAPPPPPKRSNSTKGERVVVEVKRDETSASKVPGQCGHTSERPPLPTPLDINTSSPPSEEFPPPPSPLPSVVEFQQRPKQASTGEKSEPLDELFNNPLFRQRRKDSAESSSSVESANLPFANENIGTIKQKASRPYPALPVNSSPSETFQRDLSGHRSRSNPENTASSTEEHEYDTTPDAISPGDVIDDIENMLANLSDQLDAMLDDEQAQK